jgi:hypothetical protein
MVVYTRRSTGKAQQAILSKVAFAVRRLAPEKMSRDKRWGAHLEGGERRNYGDSALDRNYEAAQRRKLIKCTVTVIP